VVRHLAAALALNRCAFGLGYLIAPERMGRGWVDRAAEQPPTQVMIRGLGARDLALGAGGLWSILDDNESPRPWFAAHALADAADLVATLAARQDLPRRRVAFAGTMAAVSTAIAVAAAANAKPVAVARPATDGQHADRRPA
jgi:hypothetical protein